MNEIVEIFAKVDEFLSGRDFPKALALLDNIQLQEIESDEDRSKYHHLFARYYIGVGENKNARVAIDSAIALSTKVANKSLLADQNFLLGQVMIALGQITDAVETYMEVFALRKKVGEHDKLWLSYLMIAQAHFMKGDLEASLRSLDNASREAEKYNTPRELLFCRRNMTRVLLFLGEFAKVERMLKDFEESGELDQPSRAFILQSLGMLNVFRLNEDLAKKYLDESQEIYKKCNMRREFIVGLEYLGLNEYFSLNFERAKKYFEDILSMVNLTESAKVQTQRLLVETYIALDEYERANAVAKNAEKTIIEIREVIELGAIYRAQGQILAKMGNVEEAYRRYNEAIDLIQKTGARYELAVTYLTCGSSEIYAKDVRLDYLRKAKNLFDLMGVSRRVDMIGDLIAQLDFDDDISSLSDTKTKSEAMVNNKIHIEKEASLLEMPKSEAISNETVEKIDNGGVEVSDFGRMFNINLYEYSKSFTEKGFDEFRETISEISASLFFDSKLISKAHKSETISSGHVEEAKNKFVDYPQKTLLKKMAPLGYVFIGSCITTVIGLLLQPSLVSNLSLNICLLLGCVGFAIVGYSWGRK